MPGFIKSAADERLWDTAKDRARAAATKGGVYNVWGLANSIFHKMKSGEMVTEEESFTPELENGRGLINNILEDDCYNDIKHYVVHHPVYGNLSENELYETVEACYEDYLQKNKDLSTGLIYEFVNQYFNGSGMSSGGYFAGGNVLGGYRDEKPIGPIVYGTPDNGLGPAAINKNRPKPAVVITPDHKSNYKPWETDLDSDGNAVSDIERNKVISQDHEVNQLWNNLSSEIAFALEDSGVDVDELENMSQEEIEDVLTKVVKQHMSQSNNTATKNAVSQLSEKSLKIEEAFAWELSEDRIDGKTRRAREILAKKHQIKRAIERDEHKRYVMDKRTIEKTMFKFGYGYDKNGWSKRQPKAKKAKPVYVAPIVTQTTDKPETDNKPVNQPIYKKIERPEAPKVQPKMKIGKADFDDKDDDDTDEETESNPLNDPVFREEMKATQARFILSIGHSNHDSTEYVKHPKTEEEIPKISDEEVLKKIATMGYTWNPDKLMWSNESMTLSNQLFAKQETLKSVWARSFLAARGRINSIKIKESGEPMDSVEDVMEDMDSNDFVFNAETNSWNWAPHEDEVSLKESVGHEVPKFIPTEEDDEVLDEAKKKEPNDVNLGYDPYVVARYQARFLLRAEYLNQYKNWVQKKNRPALAIEHAWAKIQDANNNPVNFEKNNISKPTMGDNHVIRDLENLGYQDDNKNGVITWSKKGTLPPYIHEDKQSLLGRAILTAISKRPDYLMFNDAAAKKGNISPDDSIDRVKKDIEQHLKFTWTDEEGWVKSSENDDIVSPVQREYARQMAKIVQQFKDADWNSLTSEQKNQFERASAYPKIISFFGMDENDFPAENTPTDEQKREELFRKFKKKWVLQQDDRGNRDWIRRKNPIAGELTNNGKLKSAAFWLAKKLGKGGLKLGFGLGTGLIQGLLKLNQLFEPGAQSHNVVQDMKNLLDKHK